MHVISAWKPYVLITKNEDKQMDSWYRDAWSITCLKLSFKLTIYNREKDRDLPDLGQRNNEIFL